MNCNITFRNLMSSFRDNVHRANKSVESCIDLDCYSLMKKYLGKKDLVKLKKSTLIESSLIKSKHSKVETSSEFINFESLKLPNSTIIIDGNNSDDKLEKIMPNMKKKRIPGNITRRNERRPKV